MELKIFCPQWGHEHLAVEDFFSLVSAAGYDGVETWLPETGQARKVFIRLLKEYKLSMVSHQHQAKGHSINEFCKSFEYYLHICMESNPVLINSHSGRDYFTLAEQLKVIDMAENFSVKNNIKVVHETHRGRIGYGPGNALDIFNARPEMKITADLSHWVCVTESYLENFQAALEEAIKRTEHIHARVGFTEGPQVPDPRSRFWQKETAFFIELWKKIFDQQRSSGNTLSTATPEFGPPPYMWTNPGDNKPLADQWTINVYMMELLRKIFEQK